MGLQPNIRFRGFTDDWEQRKFSDFTWNAGKRNKNDLDLEPLNEIRTGYSNKLTKEKWILKTVSK